MWGETESREAAPPEQARDGCTHPAQFDKEAVPVHPNAGDGAAEVPPQTVLR